MNRSTSNVVDSKVVDLQFQNQQFESNAKTSLSTIERLKQALNFKHDVKGLDEIDNSVKLSQGSLASLTGAVGSLRGALSSIGNVAVFSMIADEAIKAKNAVTGLIKSMSIDQVSSGWDKYADKTEAVQTIMSATAKEFSDTEVQMEHVNGQLDKLNWFTDETSYKFLDMVNNIGKFTSNSVELETAVTAMEGISTWAAKSGANVNEAGRAMYNLSQAISVGSVKLMDWKSIENANMATAEFKETAIQTAEELGTLTKVSDGLWKTTKGNEVSVKNFNQALSDNWFSSEVLLKTLSRYGDFTDKLHNAMEEVKTDLGTTQMLDLIDEYKEGTIDWGAAVKETGIAADRLKEILAELGSEEMEFGMKAFKAAQESKTFRDSIEYVKESVSTGWANTFEIMFGDYLQAKSLWSDFSEYLYEIFVAGGEQRNEMLRGAMDATKMATVDDWKKIETAGLASPAYLKNLRKNATEHGVKIANILSDEEWLTYALDHQLLSVEELQGAFENLGGTTKELGPINEELKASLDKALEEEPEKVQALLDKLDGYSQEDLQSVIFGDGKVSETAGELEGTLDELLKTLNLTQDSGSDLTTILESMGYFASGTSKSLTEMSREELRQLGYSGEQIKRIRELAAEGKTASEILEDLGIDTKTGTDHWVAGLHNSMETIISLINVVKETWAEMFPPATSNGIRDILESFDNFTKRAKNFVETSDELRAIIRGVVSAIDIFAKVIKASAKGAFGIFSGILEGLGINLLDVFANVGNLITDFNAWLDQTQILSKAVSFVTGAAKGAATQVRAWIDAFVNLPIVSKNVNRFKAAFSVFFKNFVPYMKGGVDRIKAFIQRIKDMGGLKLDNLGEVFKHFKRNILDYFLKFPGFKALGTAFRMLWDDIKSGIDGIGSFVWSYLSDLRLKLGDSIPGKILGFFMDMFVKVKEAVLKAWGKISSGEFNIGSVFKAIGSLFADFFDFLLKLGKKALKIALIVAPILIIVKIVKGVIGIFKTIPNLFGTISDTIGSIGGYFDAKAMGEKANALLKVAAALGVMVAAVYILTTLDTSKMLVAVGVIAALGLMLVGIMALINIISGTAKKASGIKGVFQQLTDSITSFIDAKKMEAQSKSLLYIAAAVGILVASIYVLAKLDAKQIIVATLVVAALTALMTGVLYLVSHMNSGKDKGATIKGALSMLAVALAVGLLVDAINKLKVDNGLGKKLAVIAVLVAGMTGVIALLSQMSKGKDKGATIKSALALLAVALSIRMIVGAINALKVDNSLAKRVLVIGAFLAAMTGVIVILSQMSKGKDQGATIKAALTLLAVALSIKMLVSAINALQVDKSLITRVVIIGALLAAMTGVIVVLSKFNSRGSITGVLSIVAIAGAIWVIADALNKISGVDPENLAAASLAISAIVLACTVMAAATSIFKPALLSSLAMVAVIGVIGLVIYNVAKLPVKNVTGVADAITKLMLGLSVAMAAAAAIGMVGPAAILGAGVMLVFFGAITTIVLAAMTYLADSGVLDSLVGSLTTLADGIVPFANAISGISPGSFDGLVALAGAFSQIVAGEFMSALYALFAGETPVTAFVNQLPELAQGLNDYATALGDNIDTEKVNASALAIQLLADICKNNIQDGGIVGWLTGNGDKISDFATQLPDLANGIKAYADAIDTATFNDEKIQASADLITLLSDLTNNEIPEGGVIGWLKGNGDKITDFATQLPGLAEALSEYVGKINDTDFDSTKIDASTNLAQVLAALSADTIQDGGIVGWLTGNDRKITEWSGQLKDLATGLKEYVDIIDEGTFSGDKITASTNLASVLATISGDQIDDGGVIGWLTGSSTKIEDFAGQLPTLAEALATYMSTINAEDFDANKIEASQTLASTLATLAGQQIDDGGVIGWITGSKSKVEDFAGQLPALATALATYMSTINAEDFDATKIEASQTLASTLATLAGNEIPDGGVIGWITGSTSKVEDFAGQLPALATALATYMSTINAEDFDANKIEASQTLASTLAALAGDKIPEGGVIGWLKGNGDKITDFATQLPGLAEALAGFMGTVSADEFDQTKIDAATGLASVLAALAGDEIPAGGIIGWLEGNADKITNFADQLPSLGTGISGFVANLSGDITSDKVKTATKAVSAIADIAEGLTNFTFIQDSKFNDFGQNLRDLAYQMEEFANSFSYNESEADPEDMLAKIKAAKSIVDALATLNDLKLKGALIDSDMISTFKTNLDTIVEALSGLKDEDFSGVDRLVGSVDKLADANYADAIKNMGGSEGEASKAGEDISSEYASGIDSGAAKDAMSGVVSDTLGVIEGATGFRGAGQSLIEKLAGGISSSQSKAAMNGAIATLLSDTTTSLNGYFSDFSESGKYVGIGFSDGLSRATATVMAAAYEMAMAAKNTIKNVFNVNSPSRVTMEIGRNVGEGLSLGILSEIGDVMHSGSALGEAARDGLNDAISTINTALSSDVDMQPVIRPVLDLSEIQNGASGIGEILSGSRPVSLFGNMTAIDQVVAQRNRSASLDDVVSALGLVERSTSNIRGGDTYNVNGITYDDGSNISDAIRILAHEVLMDRRR